MMAQLSRQKFSGQDNTITENFYSRIKICGGTIFFFTVHMIIHTPTYMHMHIHTCVHTFTYIYTCIYVSILPYIHTHCMHTCIRLYPQHIHTCTAPRVRMHACIHAHTHTHTYTHTQTHTVNNKSYAVQIFCGFWGFSINHESFPYQFQLLCFYVAKPWLKI